MPQEIDIRLSKKSFCNPLTLQRPRSHTFASNGIWISYQTSGVCMKYILAPQFNRSMIWCKYGFIDSPSP